jgi:hypothetical protein
VGCGERESRKIMIRIKEMGGITEGEDGGNKWLNERSKKRIDKN